MLSEIITRDIFFVIIAIILILKKKNTNNDNHKKKMIIIYIVCASITKILFVYMIHHICDFIKYLLS